MDWRRGRSGRVPRGPHVPRGFRVPRAARPIATAGCRKPLGSAPLPAPAAPTFPFLKGNSSSSSKIITLKNLKNSNKPLVPLCQWMLIIPGILLFSGLSSSVIPPEIARVVLITFVPFLSALVISPVPLGWGKGHSTEVASLKRLCFPCAGIKLMAQPPPSTLDPLSCPPRPECKTCAAPVPERAGQGSPSTDPQECGEHSQIVPATREREERGRRREGKSKGEKKELEVGRGGNKSLLMHGGISLEMLAG